MSIVTRGYSVGSIALVVTRGYGATAAPEPEPDAELQGGPRYGSDRRRYSAVMAQQEQALIAILVQVINDQA